jgi:hypothetical protein
MAAVMKYKSRLLQTTMKKKLKKSLLIVVGQYRGMKFIVLPAIKKNRN